MLVACLRQMISRTVRVKVVGEKFVASCESHFTWPVHGRCGAHSIGTNLDPHVKNMFRTKLNNTWHRVTLADFDSVLCLKCLVQICIYYQQARPCEKSSENPSVAPHDNARKAPSLALCCPSLLVPNASKYSSARAYSIPICFRTSLNIQSKLHHFHLISSCSRLALGSCRAHAS